MAPKNTKTVDSPATPAVPAVPEFNPYAAIDEALGTYYFLNTTLSDMATSIAKAKSDILDEAGSLYAPVDLAFELEADARIIALQRNLKSILAKVNELAEAYIADETRRRVNSVDKAEVTQMVEALRAAKAKYYTLRDMMPQVGLPVDTEKYPELPEAATVRIRSNSGTTSTSTNSREVRTSVMTYFLNESARTDYDFSRLNWYASSYKPEGAKDPILHRSSADTKALIRDIMGNPDLNPNKDEFDVELPALPNGKVNRIKGVRRSTDNVEVPAATS